MKNITVKNKQGQILSDLNICKTLEEVEDFKRINIDHKVFGKPERWVRAKIVSEWQSENPEDPIVYFYPDEQYEDSDILLDEEGNPITETRETIDEYLEYVKLRADYIIEVSDYKRVPKSVTMRQARVALIRSGLYETIQTAIENSGDEELKIDWEYSQEVQRDWDNLIALTTSLELTSDQVDDLFILAETL